MFVCMCVFYSFQEVQRLTAGTALERHLQVYSIPAYCSPSSKITFCSNNSSRSSRKSKRNKIPYRTHVHTNPCTYTYTHTYTHTQPTYTPHKHVVPGHKHVVQEYHGMHKATHILLGTEMTQQSHVEALGDTEVQFVHLVTDYSIPACLECWTAQECSP